MQKVRVPINSFQYGEISDSLIMRTDSPVYNQSAQRLENLLVTPEGAVIKRKGLEHQYTYSLTYDSAHEQSHLFKFVFDSNEEYIISVEHQKVRCFQKSNNNLTLRSTLTQDVDGAALPFDEDYLQEYTVAQYGDVMFISHPLFAPRMLVRTSLTSFEIDTYSFDARADNKVTYQPYSVFQSSGVTLDPSAVSGSSVNVEVNTQSTVDLDGICLNQSPSGSGSIALTLNGVLTSGGSVSLPSAREISITDGGVGAADHSGRTFTITGTDQDGIAQTEVVTGPAINLISYSTKLFKTISEVRISAADFNIIVGVGGKTAVSYFDITGSKTGSDYLNSTHVGVTLRYHESEMDIVSVQSSYQATVNITDSLVARLSVLNPLRTREGSNIVEVTQIDHGFNVGDEITVQNAAATGGINTGNLNVTDQVREIIDENTYTYQAGGNASSSEDGGGQVSISCHAPTTTWDEQSFSAVRGYPAAVAFHENRLCFGGTLSEPDTIWMSKIGSFFNFDVGEAADDDSINLVAATGDSHEIRYLISNRDLQVFTATGELYVPTYLNQAITPTNAQIRMQTPYGTSFVTPASIDGATVFVQKNGKNVREYLYSDSEDAYTASTISTLASHLIDNPKYLTVSHGLSDLPDSYAAFTLSNGDLALFTSNRAEKKAAWTRVTVNGRFGSVIAIGDQLYANVYDSENKLQLCKFSMPNLDFATTYVFASALTVGPLYTNGDVVTVNAVVSSTLEIINLGDFTVQDVSGVANRIDLSAYSSSGYSFIHVGKKFTTQLISNPIDANMGNGPSTGTSRGITNIIVDVKSTDSMKVNSNDVISSSFTGKKEVKTLGYNRNPQVTIEQDKPLGLQINGIVAELIV
jgi:hypothetical protein